MYCIFSKSFSRTTINGKTFWAIPFLGSDKSVVQRSQYFYHTILNKKPIRFQPYVQLSSFIGVAKLLFYGLFFSLFTKFKLGIRLLLQVIHMDMFIRLLC